MNIRSNVRVRDYNDQSVDLNVYCRDEDNAAGICLTTELQFGDGRGNLGGQKAMWLHKSILPELRDAIDRFLETGEIESKNT